MSNTTNYIDNPDAYERDQEFWKNYIRGRPRVPSSLFKRIADYHASHNGTFKTAHDVGAGVGIHSAALHEYFPHVIVSDIIPQNVEIARSRLGNDTGYSYRAKPIEDSSDLEPGSIDIVFAASMMHFARLDETYEALGKQLKPGGTLAILLCGHPCLGNAEAQEAWLRLLYRGLGILMTRTKDRELALRRLGRVGTGYDSIPVDERFFEPGAMRIRLNHRVWPSFVPDNIQREADERLKEGSAIEPDEQIVHVDEPGWSFKVDMQGLRDSAASFPFAGMEPKAFESNWKELESIIGDGEIDGYWPARLILATRR